MPQKQTKTWLEALIWLAFATAIIAPIALAATSPLLAWRGPVYIIACFAGIITLGLLLTQSMLIGRYFPGIKAHITRRAHRFVGATLVVAVLMHIIGLYITSPPDVIDVLLFNSPTPFSIWGVTAMWALFITALLAIFRKRISPRSWKIFHTLLALVILIGTVIHALQIEGLMETTSKAILCVVVIVIALRVIWKQKVWTNIRTPAKQRKS